VDSHKQELKSKVNLPSERKNHQF